MKIYKCDGCGSSELEFRPAAQCWNVQEQRFEPLHGYQFEEVFCIECGHVVDLEEEELAKPDISPETHPEYYQPSVMDELVREET